MNTIVKNTEKKRYEVEVDGYWAFITYLVAKNGIYLTHTEVPVILEGQGIGTKLVEFALKDIDNLGRKLVPLCPFVAVYLKEHPEWQRLLAPGYGV